MMRKIRINPKAKSDLLEIKKYITDELENPDAATNIVLRIVESYEKLKEFSLMGRKLSSKIGIPTDYRYIISGKYIIFYKVDEIYVSIYRILYGKRDYKKLLFEEKWNGWNDLQNW